MRVWRALGNIQIWHQPVQTSLEYASVLETKGLRIKIWRFLCKVSYWYFYHYYFNYFFCTRKDETLSRPDNFYPVKTTKVVITRQMSPWEDKILSWRDKKLSEWEKKVVRVRSSLLLYNGTPRLLYNVRLSTKTSTFWKNPSCGNVWMITHRTREIWMEF